MYSIAPDPPVGSSSFVIVTEAPEQTD